MARSFAPGHVTGIFRPELGSADPRGRGSVGAGLVLESGVRATATYRPGGRRSLRISSDVATPLPISREVMRRLYAGHPGSLDVRLIHELPIGQGFGMSAAGALSTALAIASVLDLPRRRAVEVAHLADLFGGGGLGGVSSILRGGLEIRQRPGIPPAGSALHLGFPLAIIVSVAGAPIPSPKLLRDRAFLGRVRDAAVPGLQRLSDHPTPELFLDVSEQFTDQIDIAPPSLRNLIVKLRSTGAHVAQAMFGESLFAVAGSAASRRRLIDRLTDARIPSVELRTSARGAGLTRGGPKPTPADTSRRPR
jgi:pantoate kinase